MKAMVEPTIAVIEQTPKPVVETIKIPDARTDDEATTADGQHHDNDDGELLTEPEPAPEPKTDLEMGGAYFSDNLGDRLDLTEEGPEEGPSLDEDDDTSLAESLQLHLLSEHICPSALHMDDLEAEALHRNMHAGGAVNHSIVDHRFRPGRAISTLMRSVQREHETHLAEHELDPAIP